MIWPRTGMTSGGRAYELPTPPSSRPTTGTGGSPSRIPLLKTPTAQLGTNGGPQHPDKRKGGGHGPTLEDEAVFLLANAHIGGRDGRTGNESEPDGRDEPPHGRDAAPRAAGVVRALPTPAARDWKSGASNLIGTNSRPLNEVVVNTIPDEGWLSTDGKDYGPAIRRWEAELGRPAPCPTEPGERGNRRLSPVFEEWMMGLPDGWVTGVPGITRKEQMIMLGNGAMWQQAHEAYSRLFAMDVTVPEQQEG